MNTAELAYPCSNEDCERRFGSLKAWREHIAEHHSEPTVGTVVVDESKQRPEEMPMHSCNECAREFTTAGGLSHHVTVIHPGVGGGPRVKPKPAPERAVVTGGPLATLVMELASDAGLNAPSPIVFTRVELDALDHLVSTHPLSSEEIGELSTVDLALIGAASKLRACRSGGGGAS